VRRLGIKTHKAMSWINRLISTLVGSLFIFSGLIKINDPVGTAIKLEEYFEVFALDKEQLHLSILHGLWEFLVPYSLYIGIFLCVLEVVLGVALLVNYRKVWTINLLLAIIVFFTFLTFYSAYFNKVTDCGCFGDAIKLTPWQSFYKDILLLVLILVLWVQRKTFTNMSSTISQSIVLASAFICSFLAYYAVSHLPFIDFRNYKVGNHIPTLMKQQEPCRYEYIMEKDGKLHTFQDYPSDTTYKFKEMVVINSEACEPKIKDFKLWNDEGDFTEEALKGNKLLIIVHDLNSNTYIGRTHLESFPAIVKLTNELKNVTPMVLTSAESRFFEQFRHEIQLSVPYYLADATLLKTMIRSNPGLILLKDGTVKAQWHYNDIPNANDNIFK